MQDGRANGKMIHVLNREGNSLLAEQLWLYFFNAFTAQTTERKQCQKVKYHPILITKTGEKR